MEFVEITKEVAYKYVHKYHYSKVMPRLTKKFLLVKEGDNELGVITLGRGTQPLGTIRKLFNNHDLDTKDYYEIGKMCFRTEYNNSNYGSRIMSGLIKWLKLNTDILFLYTLADGIMGKPGYVYQASNFKYIGMFWTSVYYDTNTGEKIHPRTAKEILNDNARYLGKEKLFRLTYDYMALKGIKKIDGKMFRYIYPLNSRAKKILKEYNYNYTNPKEKDLEWYWKKGGRDKEKIPMPIFNMGIEDGYNGKNIKSFIK